MSADSAKLADVLTYVEEVLGGMILRPAMYGTPQSLEFEFLRLLELKEVALGRRTMREFLPVSHPELILNQWMKFVDEKFQEGPRVFPLTGRRKWTDEDLQELSGYFAEFRTRVDL